MLSLFRSVLTEFLTVLKLMAVLLRLIVWGLTVRPKGFGARVQVKEEIEGMAKVFTYKQGLLAVPVGVASQRLVVTVDGVSGEPITIASEATDVEFKAGPEGVTVELSLDYLDSAGNDSANATTSFVVADAIGPDMPAGFGELVQTAEEDDGT